MKQKILVKFSALCSLLKKERDAGSLIEYLKILNCIGIKKYIHHFFLECLALECANLYQFDRVNSQIKWPHNEKVDHHHSDHDKRRKKQNRRNSGNFHYIENLLKSPLHWKFCYMQAYGCKKNKTDKKI